MSSSTASEVPVAGRALTNVEATVELVCGSTVLRLIKPGGVGVRVGAASVFLSGAGGAGVTGVGGRLAGADVLVLSAGVTLP